MTVLDYVRCRISSGSSIAAALGLTPEAVYQELVRLDARGLIRAKTCYSRGLSPWIVWEAA